MIRRMTALAALLAAALPLTAAEKVAYEVTVTPSAASGDRLVPVTVPLKVPAALATSVRVAGPDGVALPLAQATPPSLSAGLDAAGGEAAVEVHFATTFPKAGEAVKFLVEFGDRPDKPGTTGEVKGVTVSKLERDTLADKRTVARLITPAFDDSEKDARFLSYKPFHHLFDPATGKVRLTNGPVVEADKLVAGELGKYPHHRGIYFGFNKVSYGPKGEKKADVWHCTGDAHQTFEGLAGSSAGPLFARDLARVDWHGPGKEVFAKETRELAFFNLPGGTLVEFASLVTPAVEGTVKLDGDPQHAGFHFRANALVEKETAKETYFLRPDGQGKPGETRNWEPKTKEGPTNLPWDAMSFVLGGKRYTVLYLNHPDNPGESRHSERDYGRIGCYFEYDATKEKPLKVRYRLWAQEGDMTGEQCAALHKAFTDPPKVTVAKK